jgi:hypothetical protein
MSAFIVSEEHILTLAYHYKKMVVNHSNDKSIDINDVKDIAKVLWKENYKSVNFRYRENYRVSKFKNELPIVDISLVPLYKLINCWEYQTCEHEGHDRSKAWKMMQDLKLRILDNVMQWHQPFANQYDDAKWSL